MQPAQKACESAKSALAHFGASADACRGPSMQSARAVADLPPEDRHRAERSMAREGHGRSICDRSKFLPEVGSTRLADSLSSLSERRRPGKSMDDDWGRADAISPDSKSYLDQWAKADPVGFKAFVEQAKGMAQDLLALARISPATARCQGDLALFRNAKCSAVVKEAVAQRMAASDPHAPGSPAGFPKP